MGAKDVEATADPQRKKPRIDYKDEPLFPHDIGKEAMREVIQWLASWKLLAISSELDFAASIIGRLENNVMKAMYLASREEADKALEEEQRTMTAIGETAKEML